ncbi:MAG: hypothetical protein U0174_14280 [Polyangiaceae bacterium]
MTCSGACVDTSKDSEHCGSCDRACAATDVCQNGTCKLACTDGMTACTNVVSPADAGTQSDADSAAPEAGGTVTAPYCAKLSDDPKNCGQCGKTCDVTQTCQTGACCKANETGCAGTCTVLSDDPKNCGKCGTVCSGATPYCSNGTCNVRYIKAGVQTNVPESVATGGWQQCFRETFGQSSALSTMKAACNKANLMVACKMVGQPDLLVLAQGPRADVLFDVGNGSTATHAANGVNWYYSESWSWGFAPGGAPVMRQSCDTQDSSAGDPTQTLRMCIHTSSGSTSSGYRCGANSSVNANFERIVYQAD